ncbi:MAG: NAD(P)H-dependent glycerol-3-phosphate dehydrogenase [Gemmatimonadota bacterium]
MTTRIAVLGGGAWGTALGDTLARNGHEVRIWTRNAEVAEEICAEGSNRRYLHGASLSRALGATTELPVALADAAIVLSACPSHAVREVLEAARPLLRPPAPIVISATKGIEIGTDLRMSEVLGQVLGPETERRIVVVSGPSFAEELARQLPTAVVAASVSQEAAQLVQGLFQNRYLRVYTQRDVVGVEFGGSLKNVIALAAGISDGLELGSNARAALITRGLAEITRLATRFGAHETTLAGLAGIGDLVLTCTGDLSRNRTAGLAIGSGRPPPEVLAGMGQVVEGVRTTRATQELAERRGVEMPIVEAVYSILYEDVGPRDALARLMSREPKPERWS